MQVFEFNIAADYLPYIINGDASIFDYFGDDELQEHLDWWLDKNTRDLGAGHYSVTEEEYSDNFKTCDITGSFANCVTITYTVM